MAKFKGIPLLFSFLLLPVTMAIGYFECEDLPIADCAFAVSSSGVRCVLEKSALPTGETSAECQTSIIMAEKPMEWIETDECINSCGLERISYGLSTDALLEKDFTAKLCSSECQNHCPNIVDLYLKLAAGEGVYLPHLCTTQQSRSRRLIADPVEKVRSKISKRARNQKQIAAGPLEAAAYSPTELPDAEKEEIEDNPALAPSSSPEETLQSSTIRKNSS